MYQLRGEVVRKMDELAAEVRRALAAVAMAQTVAQGARQTGGRGGVAARGRSGSPGPGDGGARHHNWKFGQLRID